MLQDVPALFIAPPATAPYAGAMMARLIPLSVVLAAMATLACAQEGATRTAEPPWVAPGFETSGSPEFDAWRARFAAVAVNEHRADPAIVVAALAGLAPDPTVKRLNEAQPELVRPIWDYLRSAVSEARIARGRAELAARRAQLQPLVDAHGVPLEFAIAIWAMESNFGGNRGSMDVVRSLATLAYTGRRTQLGERELLAVFEILRRGEASRSMLIGSWAGAMGHTQFMPTSFLARAIDGDGDGVRNIWTDADDGLASTLNYLQAAGWPAGQTWGFETRLPGEFDWALADGQFRPLSFWRLAGFAPVATGIAASDPAMELRLLVPAGAEGPVFLVGRGYMAIRDYNASDSYALAVAIIGDAIAGRGQLPTGWPTGNPPVQRAEAREMQERLNALGFDVGVPDGIAGSNTRRQLQAFQRSRGLTPDGYPSRFALEALRSVGGGAPAVAPGPTASGGTGAAPPAPGPGRAGVDPQTPVRMFGPASAGGQVSVPPPPPPAPAAASGTPRP